ncbi:MAG TPA: efflux RND transporter periplasmic adaptor subunit [Acidobacteriaceae bacterium]|jgi:membrane fusion protein (multidrug efflux system)|nr:efflux RND transporter periplasmic adaptor subunit [Acidobacteriaceae bacterium]
MAATLAIGIGLGCSSGGSGTGTVAAAAAVTPTPPSAAQSPTPAPSQSGEAIVTSGPVVVEQQLDVVALRAGVIASMGVDVGSEVQKGQVLARLDDRQVAADRSAAEYKEQSLESDLKNWQSAVDVKKADLARAQAMREAGINTQEALDHAKADLTATQYEVERQRGEMQSAQATVKSLELELEKTQIAAPFGGVVSQRYVRLGQYVVTGDKLFQVTGNSPLEIRFTLPERDVTALRRGDLVTVSPTPEFRVTSTARVTHLSPVVDPGSGTIEVTAALTRKVPGLLPGMVASVRVTPRP